MELSGADNPLTIWDSLYAPQGRQVTDFRQVLSSIYLPWHLERVAGTHFAARIEAAPLASGAIGRLHVSPMVAWRREPEISAGDRECCFAYFVISGELVIEQHSNNCVLKAGNFAVFDGNAPVKLTSSGANQQMLALLFAKSALTSLARIHHTPFPVLTTRARLGSPLASCLEHLTENMLDMSREELEGIFDAIVALVPTLEPRHRRKSCSHNLFRSSKQMLDITTFINNNLSSPQMSPILAAEQLEISARYVHKLFAAHGITFMSYVTERRLEKIVGDLRLSKYRHQPIVVIAHRWGFRDFSTFTRAFKSRFKQTPGSFRASIA